MARLWAMLACLCVLVGCAVEPGQTSKALGTLCGWQRIETLTLTHEAPCWRVDSSGDCIAADPAISSACDLPDDPRELWRAGEQVTLWCSVLQPGEASTWMRKVECDDPP